MAPAPISLWFSGILSPWGMTFWLSGSPEVKGVRGTQVTSGSVFPSPPPHTWWAYHWTPLFGSCRLTSPSLNQCYFSSLLFLCSLSNLLRSHSIPISGDRCFSLTSSEQTDSNLFQFVFHDLMKETGGAFSLSSCNFWAALWAALTSQLHVSVSQGHGSLF